MTLSVSDNYGLIVPVCLTGILYSLFNAWKVSKVNLTSNDDYTA
jgi:hypothetical protein